MTTLNRNKGLGAIGLFGEPGSGKTTFMRSILKHFPPMKQGKYGCVSFMHDPGSATAIIGSYTGHTFDGTDRLSIAVYAEAPLVLSMLRERLGVRTLLWEGDRLARARWIDTCEADGWAVNLIHLTIPADEGIRRRQARGTGQSESWVTGRRTLCQRLAAARGAQGCCLANPRATDALRDECLAFCSLGPPPQWGVKV